MTRGLRSGKRGCAATSSPGSLIAKKSNLQAFSPWSRTSGSAGGVVVLVLALAAEGGRGFPVARRATADANLAGGLLEEDARTRRLDKSRRGRLAAFWLASGPADSATIDSSPAGFLLDAPGQSTLFAKFLAGFCSHPVCNPDADGETIHAYCGVPSAQLPGGRTDLAGRLYFCGSRSKAPPHDCAWGGAVAPTSYSPTPAIDDGRGEVAPSA